MKKHIKSAIFSSLACLTLLAPLTAQADWSECSIMIDPGHGGSDPGAVNGSTQADGSHKESVLALRCAQALADKLRALGSTNFRLTRTTDVLLDLTAIANASAAYDPWVFNAIHLNSFGDPSAHGTETWYYWENNAHVLANYVQATLVAEMGLTNRGVKQQAWTVITGSENVPAILTEGAFISNPTEWNSINATNKQGFKNWVNGHINGWYDYLHGVHNFALTDPRTLNQQVQPDPEPEPDPAVPSAPQQRNVFAYDVTIDKSTPASPKVSYKLNTEASSVDVDLYVDNAKVGTKNIAGSALTGTASFAGIIGKGKVTARVTPHNKTNVTAPTRVSFKPDACAKPASNGLIRFYEPYTVAVNNCTDSPTFGMILVAEGAATGGTDANYYSTCSSSRGSMDQSGHMGYMFAFDPQMQGIVNSHINQYGFSANLDNVAQQSDFSLTTMLRFHRLRYSADGRLFNLSSSKTGGALFELDASSAVALNNQATKLYSGTQNGLGEYYNGSTWIGGSGAGLDVWGTGDNLKIAVVSSPNLTVGTQNSQRVSIYNLGKNKSITSGPAATNFDPPIFYLTRSRTAQAAFDPDGNGLFVTNLALNPSGTDIAGLHLKTSDLSTNYNVTSTANPFTGVASIAYNKDRTLLAVGASASGRKGEIRIFAVSGAGNGAVPTLTLKGTVSPNDENVLGCNIEDLAWDYANNLYAVSDISHSFTAYQIPTSWAGGDAVTPSPASQAYDLDNMPTVSGLTGATGVWQSDKHSQKSKLTWNAASGAQSYKVMRNGTVIASGITATTYDAPMLINAYTGNQTAAANSFTVRAVVNGVDCPVSAAVTPKCADFGTITVSKAIAANSAGKAVGRLTWTVPANGKVAHYELFKNGTKFNASIAATATTIDVEATTTATSYHIAAVMDQVINTPTSTNAYYVTTPTISVQVPTTTLTAEAATWGTDKHSQKSHLTWTAATGAQSYAVYRDGTKLADGITDTSYDAPMLINAYTGSQTAAANAFTVYPVINNALCSGSNAVTPKCADFGTMRLSNGITTDASTGNARGFLSWYAPTYGKVNHYELYKGASCINNNIPASSFNTTVDATTTATDYHVVAVMDQVINTAAANNVHSVTSPTVTVAVPTTTLTAAAATWGSDNHSQTTHLTWTADSRAHSYSVYRNGSLLKAKLTGTSYDAALVMNAFSGNQTAATNTFTVYPVINNALCPVSNAVSVRCAGFGSVTLNSALVVGDDGEPLARLTWNAPQHGRASAYDVYRGNSILTKTSRPTFDIDATQLGSDYHVVAVMDQVINVAGGGDNVKYVSSNTVSVKQQTLAGIEQPTTVYAYKNGAVIARPTLAEADSITVAQNVSCFAHLSKTPAFSVARSGIDSLSFMPAAIRADLIDVDFGANATATDHAANRALQFGHATGAVPMTYFDTDLQRYVAHFDNPDTDNPTTWVVAKDFAGNTDFINRVKDGYTIEMLATFDNPNPANREHKAFGCTEAGGLTLERMQNGKLTSLIYAGGAYHYTNAASLMACNAYYHVVAVWNKTAGKMRIFVDGQQSAESDATGELAFPTVQSALKFVVGADPGSTNNMQGGWCGSIALARLYDQVLQPAQVADRYQTVLHQGQNAPRLVEWYTYSHTAKVASTVQITGKGFVSGDRAVLVSPSQSMAAGTAVVMTVANNQASFTLPASITAGRYALYVDRNGVKQSLGVLKVVQ